MRENISYVIKTQTFEGDYRLRILQVFKQDGRTGIAVEYGIRPFDQILGVSIPDDLSEEVRLA